MAEPPKAAPPPVPSRTQRLSLTITNPVVDAPPADQQSSENQEEYQEEEIPTEVANGEPLVEQTVAPNRYRWYTVVVSGKEDDIVDFRVSRTLHAAAANIYVNIPPADFFPSQEYHDWNPTKGPLYGPVGEYKISIQGVPSFIEKDDKYLVDPNSNWATFDLLVEWTILDEQTKEMKRKIKEQYTREKSSNVWSSGYNKEVGDRYIEQQQEYMREQAERERQEQGSQINLDNHPVSKAYTLGAALGAGGNDFYSVRSATEKSTGKEYAVKILDKDLARQTGIDESTIRYQIDILKSMSHEHICPLKEVFDNDEALCLVLELQQGGDIISRTMKQQSYTEDNARRIVRQVLEAVRYLHSKNIIHKQVVPENILFSTRDNDFIKLVGFTLAQVSKDDNELGVSGGDPSFQAPEIIQQEGYGRAVDMWSVGVVAYILLCGARPFKDNNTMRLYAKIRQGSYEMAADDWKNVSADAQSFVKALICVDPSKRLTAEQALNHPWIKANGGSPLPRVVENLHKYYQ